MMLVEKYSRHSARVCAALMTIFATLFAILVGGCNSTPNFVNRNLPARSDVIPPKEAAPDINKFNDVRLFAIANAHALERANDKLDVAAKNYDQILESVNRLRPDS